MGPRSVTADRFPYGRSRRLDLVLLQWGRGLSPRIGHMAPAKWLTAKALQWGRGLSPRIGYNA